MRIESKIHKIVHRSCKLRRSEGSTKSIDIVYDAAGNKLSKTVKTGTTINSIQDYVMGIEYNKLGTATRKPEAVYHTEGRFFNTSTTSTPSWRTEYSIKDHLGNTRLTFTDKNNNAKHPCKSIS